MSAFISNKCLAMEVGDRGLKQTTLVEHGSGSIIGAIVNPIDEQQALAYTGNQSNVLGGTVTTNETLKITLNNDFDSGAVVVTTPTGSGVNQINYDLTGVTTAGEFSLNSTENLWSLAMYVADETFSTLIVANYYLPLLLNEFPAPASGESDNVYNHQDVFKKIGELYNDTTVSSSGDPDMIIKWDATTEVLSLSFGENFNLSSGLADISLNTNSTGATSFSSEQSYSVQNSFGVSFSTTPKTTDSGNVVYIPSSPVEVTTSRVATFSLDPDTADAVYSTDIPTTSFVDNSNVTTALTKIGTDIAAIETDITWNEVVTSVDGEYIDVTYTVLSFENSNFRIVKMGGVTYSDSSPATSIEFIRDRLFNLAVYINTTKAYGFTITKVSTDKIRLVGTGAAKDVTFISNNSSNEPIISAVATTGTLVDNGTSGISVTSTDYLKYITIDLGTSTDIEPSLTITANSGTNTTPMILASDAGTNPAPHTSYTVFDYNNNEVTTFTGSVAASGTSDLSTINTQIINAVNSNSETPTDFTATDDSTNNRLLLTATVSEVVTGNWSVTVEHYDSSTPGNIFYTQSVIAVGSLGRATIGVTVEGGGLTNPVTISGETLTTSEIVTALTTAIGNDSKVSIATVDSDTKRITSTDLDIYPKMEMTKSEDIGTDTLSLEFNTEILGDKL